jgi:N6-L-threonylcarbamoyladenine synthase
MTENSKQPRQRTLIMAIETSCDETSVAVVADGVNILSNVISSQIDIHQRFGGVVPEIASRKHVETITRMMAEALQAAGVHRHELTAVAVTQGPGLVGSLLVGMMAAKTFAYALEIPLIGVHHIVGHIYANALVHQLQYPLMALVVSGGHTELVHVPEEGKFEIIGCTRDDAVGEAYDKVARALGLSYPGGPHVDKLAHQADAEIEMPRAWLEAESYDFSFSGIKAHVLSLVNQAKMRGDVENKPGISLGFQRSVSDVLVTKTMRAAVQYGVKQVLLCGGVAANRGLRGELQAACNANAMPLLLPPLDLCTDNAAMIAAAAYLKWKRGEFASLELKAEPMFSLEMW